MRIVPFRRRDVIGAQALLHAIVGAHEGEAGAVLRIAILASNRSKQLGELDTELVGLLPEIDRYKSALTALVTRIECISEISRYWLAYLDIAGDEKIAASQEPE